MKRKHILISIILGAVILSLLILPLFQAAAIEEAKNYKRDPEIACTAEMTPAMHVLTGARYEFFSGCLAPGWITLWR